MYSCLSVRFFEGRVKRVGSLVVIESETLIMAEAQEETLLSRVHRLEQELEHLKRALLLQLTAPPRVQTTEKPSLFGCVRGGDITEELVEEAKQHLFRDLQDL